MEATKDQALGPWYRQEGKVCILILQSQTALAFLLFHAVAVLLCSLTCVAASLQEISQCKAGN